MDNFNGRNVGARRMISDNRTRASFVYSCVLFILLTVPFFIGSCALPGQGKKSTKVSLTINNSLLVKRTDVPIVLSLEELKKVAGDFSLNAVFVVYANTPRPTPIASQMDDIDNDGERDELVFLVDLEPQETKEIDIYYSPQKSDPELIASYPLTVGYPPRTLAGVFPELKGIAWESELIASRVPFNERTSVEVFLKEKAGLSLRQLAKEPEGEWLDGGGYALWDGENFVWQSNEVERYVEVIAAGPIRPIVKLTLSNWEFKSSPLKVISTFSMFAGGRLSKYHLKVHSDDSPAQIAVGLPKMSDSKPVFDEEKGYFYVWDGQSGGFAIIYPTEHFNSFEELKRSEEDLASAVILTPDKSGQVQYYLLAAASSGELAVKTEEDFAKLIRHTITEISTPPILNIQVSKSK